MNETEVGDKTLPEHEQKVLDTALLESDQLLARSLRNDQLRRKRFWWLAVVLGGIAVSGLFVAIYAGWLTLGGHQTQE